MILPSQLVRRNKFPRQTHRAFIFTLSAERVSPVLIRSRSSRLRAGRADVKKVAFLRQLQPPIETTIAFYRSTEGLIVGNKLKMTTAKNSVWGSSVPRPWAVCLDTLPSGLESGLQKWLARWYHCSGMVISVIDDTQLKTFRVLA